jgi:protein-S-isoprenylcysteine O-methyltransferase Ste14
LAVPSSALVALQFALIAALLASCWPPAPEAPLAIALLLLAASAAVGLAAIAVNRPGNFNIRPELKAGARLASTGIYRRLRHPMYTSVLLAALAAWLAVPSAWRLAVWLALLAVLVAKARREERYLLQRFPAYADYRARTWALLPWLW